MTDRNYDQAIDPRPIDEPVLAIGERTRCEVWTRVMGYHRPVAAWNPGKQSEHGERSYYKAAV